MKVPLNCELLESSNHDIYSLLVKYKLMNYITNSYEIGEMAQWVKTSTAKPDELSWITDSIKSVICHPYVYTHTQQTKQ